MVVRLKRGRRRRSCQLCGNSLQPEARAKYDVFWPISLIALGAILTWYLYGVLLMAAGLWLLTRKRMQWVCPLCTAEPGLSRELIS